MGLMGVRMGIRWGRVAGAGRPDSVVMALCVRGEVNEV